MAVPVELCCLESFPPRLSPLDVLVHRTQQDSVFRGAAGPPVVLFAPQRPQPCQRGGILLRVHAATPEQVSGCGAASRPDGDESAPRTRLFTSRFFLRHHRLPRTGCTGSVRPMEPVELDRVVLGARSRRSFRSAGAESFTAGLRELCGRGEEWLLARRGDPLLLPLLSGEDPEQEQVRQQQQLVVLDCSPVLQGRITPNTALVLTDCYPSPAPPFPARPFRLCVSDFAHQADLLSGDRSLLDLLSPQSSEYDLDVWVGDTRRWRGLDVDADGCVFVSKQLLLHLGLFNREWVRLRRVDGEAEGRERPAQVVVVEDHTPAEHTAVISATQWFNLTGGEAALVETCRLWVKRWSPPPAESSSHRSDTSCRTACPPVAAELHLQPVAAPGSPGNYDELLAEHFSLPRLVSLGDVLTVPTDKHPDLLEERGEGVQRSVVLFFKVQKVKTVGGQEDEGGGSYLADREYTSLYMGAPTSSLAPWLSLDPDSLWGGAAPAGMEQTVEQLCASILPHLQHSECLPRCSVLLHGPAGAGKSTAVRAAARRLHLHLLKVDCVTVSADTPAATEAKLTSALQRAETLQPCLLLLRNLQLLLCSPEDGRVQAALGRLLSGTPARAAVVATVPRASLLSAGAAALFLHRVALQSPGEEQRLSTLTSLSQPLQLGADVSLERLAKVTAGLVLGDLSALVVEAGRAACRRLSCSCGSRPQTDVCSSGVTVQQQDFSSALQTLQDAQSTSIGAPKIPSVRWEDVGGLHQVKREILDTVQLPLQRPELRALGLSRTGLLLHGPPGTGKTLLAKAVATECSMTFLSVKGPELINMYVGQSEENVREVFQRARSAAPCVIFFDELDSLAPSRGRSGDSGGVMDRVVSQLLAELDSLNSSAGVFVIGATNRPDLLDQSLLRPGRFDKLVYVGINADRESQLQVLQAVLRKFHLDSTVNLQDLLDRCPARMTGADLYALCSDAMTAAVKRKILLIQDGLDSEDAPLLLNAQDFWSALENFKPSVSEQELQKYQDMEHKLSAK